MYEMIFFHREKNPLRREIFIFLHVTTANTYAENF